MAFPTIGSFDVNFIERTINNLDANVEFEFSHLLNSLVGMIILPRQMIIQGRRIVEIFNQTLDTFEFLEGLNEQVCIIDDVGHENVIDKFISNQHFGETSLQRFISNLRHSIAHQSLRPTRDGDLWNGVIFRCYPNRQDEQVGLWANNYYFQVYFTYNELRNITRSIARMYLDNLE